MPPVEIQAERYTLYPGDRLELSCKTDSVNWTKDHAVVLDGEHTRLRDGQLEIEGVEPADSGLYTCVTFGNHSSYFSVNVTGKVKTTTEGSNHWSCREKQFKVCGNAATPKSNDIYCPICLFTS